MDDKISEMNDSLKAWINNNPKLSVTEAIKHVLAENSVEASDENIRSLQNFYLASK